MIFPTEVKFIPSNKTWHNCWVLLRGYSINNNETFALVGLMKSWISKTFAERFSGLPPESRLAFFLALFSCSSAHLASAWGRLNPKSHPETIIVVLPEARPLSELSFRDDGATFVHPLALLVHNSVGDRAGTIDKAVAQLIVI